MIACSRMYNVFPRCKQAWQNIFERVFQLADVPLTVIDHAAPAPLDELWARDDLGCVFMCGWPYAMAEPRPRLIAAPAPSPARYAGQAVYVTDFVVRADSTHKCLEDTFGGVLAWTVDHSHSGYNAPRYHLLRYRSVDRPVLYPTTVGPVITPRAAMQSLLDGAADVAPFDSVFFDLLRRYDPDQAAQLRVVESTDPAPMPPLIASASADPVLCSRLTNALVGLHGDRTIATSLEDVLFSRFVAVTPEDYQVTRERAVAGAEYPFPA